MCVFDERLRPFIENDATRADLLALARRVLDNEVRRARAQCASTLRLGGFADAALYLERMNRQAADTANAAGEAGRQLDD